MSNSYSHEAEDVGLEESKEGSRRVSPATGERKRQRDQAIRRHRFQVSTDQSWHAVVVVYPTPALAVEHGKPSAIGLWIHLG